MQIWKLFQPVISHDKISNVSIIHNAILTAVHSLTYDTYTIDFFDVFISHLSILLPKVAQVHNKLLY